MAAANTNSLANNPAVGGMPASAANSGDQKSAFGANATNMSWRSPANPAALDATDRNAATGTGAPSYVSGAQNWNGTAETLNPNPATTSRIAARESVSAPPCTV